MLIMYRIFDFCVSIHDLTLMYVSLPFNSSYNVILEMCYIGVLHLSSIIYIFFPIIITFYYLGFFINVFYFNYL